MSAAATRPIPPGTPLPHRKTIRQWLVPLASKATGRALLLLVLDAALLGAALAGTVLLAATWAKLLCGIGAGFVIGRLFILGHDACHQSLTPHRGLNKWIGRIAFLPSITPYSLWDVGHNVVHHGYTNLKGFDFVWAPCTREEYAALGGGRRLLDRIYRSGWAPGLYYLVEIWWKRMFFPARRHMPTRRPVFLWDNLLVSAYAVLWAGGLAWAARATGQSTATVLVAGFVVPFLVWCAMIGFVVYVHHTHTAVSWHDERTAWAQAAPFVSTTVHLTFPLAIGSLLHHIMEHTAHHVDMGIPLYRLKQAQARLEELLPGRIVIQRFSWRWYFDTARRCKLYDFQRRCWTDYAGRATSAPRPA
ncbi:MULTISPECIES: fatty acid desaturase [Ramlibacter]|uniref:Fatty acid desaturase n=1 Tax=Ramlibacter pinisoli TaxID=2682844 RepID=A0A6N8J3S8_9BURK|nr:MULTISPECIES: fatty acid desaturase [Ramlibacter]MBA2962970.1 fatty acid desaturase [Ramlibacter sp. CGMCC 1.13660]MVQ32913.1 fatty acid desaturase [Ramlibacter pinisoli]